MSIERGQKDRKRWALGHKERERESHTDEWTEKLKGNGKERDSVSLRRASPGGVLWAGSCQPAGLLTSPRINFSSSCAVSLQSASFFPQSHFRTETDDHIIMPGLDWITVEYH